jgi:hypothetical protein
MLTRRRALILASAALVLLSTGSSVFAQARQLTKDEDREVKAIAGAIANVMQGKAVGNDLGLTWVRLDAMQAQEDKSIMAYLLKLDPAKAPSGKVSLLWRVLPAGADPKAKVAPVFENYSTATIENGSPFVGRLILAPAGKFDVYVGAHEMVEGKASKAPISVIKQTIDIPVLSGGELLIGNLYAFRARKYSAPLADVMEHPYGTTEEESLPLDNPTYAKTEPLRINGMIFNATGRVGVEYAVFKEGSSEPFKRYSAAEIDPTRQGIPDSIPLTDFEPGKYRLEIKATDKGTSKTVTQSLAFTVGS